MEWEQKNITISKFSSTLTLNGCVAWLEGGDSHGGCVAWEGCDGGGWAWEGCDDDGCDALPCLCEIDYRNVHSQY